MLIPKPFILCKYYNFEDDQPPDDSILIDLKRDMSDVVKVDVHDKIYSTPSQKSNISLPVPSTSHQQHHTTMPKSNSKISLANSLHNFSSRTIKHHTFDSGFQDVKNMEKNLISLLDDFHNGERLQENLEINFQV